MVLDHARAGIGSEQVPIVCLLDQETPPTRARCVRETRRRRDLG